MVSIFLLMGERCRDMNNGKIKSYDLRLLFIKGANYFLVEGDAHNMDNNKYFCFEGTVN